MRILITAGGTREYIDPVRFISNASSGRMGCALAREALKAGHSVTLITAPTSRRRPQGAKIVEVETTAQMFKAVKQHFAKSDCLIMAAAVADYTPLRPAKAKIKRESKALTLKLKPTPDIVRWAGTHKTNKQIVVGFALEEKDLRTQAEKKLRDKNLDMIIANTPAAINSPKSTVQIKTPASTWVKIKHTTKAAVGRRIVLQVENLLQCAKDSKA